MIVFDVGIEGHIGVLEIVAAISAFYRAARCSWGYSRAALLLAR